MGVQRCQPSATCCDWVRATSTGPKTAPARKAPLASQNNPTRMIAFLLVGLVCFAQQRDRPHARHGPAAADSRPAPDAAHLCSPRRLTQCRCAIASERSRDPSDGRGSARLAVGGAGVDSRQRKASGTGASGAPLEQRQRQRLIYSATAELGLTKGLHCCCFCYASLSSRKTQHVGEHHNSGRWTHGARWHGGGQPVIGEYFITRRRP
ncbi:hypothetical protein K491DRAFT_372221 [Lophiostoma macrostomum CBS 122681]|uniref:Uncharacterized protein n=1 Tax=Lophiostoma macrostomum CBS 122681 TaxID=1314788 RepID=A0A6A6TA18_9PLEO|nr:hypothetical protein K491DRAFT_372221 [Lophiostoma macrostomum CBS 122681]